VIYREAARKAVDPLFADKPEDALLFPDGPAPRRELS
jgi:hypothetical protein